VRDHFAVVQGDSAGPIGSTRLESEGGADASVVRAPGLSRGGRDHAAQTVSNEWKKTTQSLTPPRAAYASVPA